MRFAILFPLVAIGLCLITRNNGGWTWLLLWPALSFALVGLAYTLGSPRLFGKRANGKLFWWSTLLLFPYLIYAWLLWHLVRLFHRLHSTEPYASQIAPRVWLSRRILRREIPQGVTCIVDMTCEFPAARGLVQQIPHYLALPTLDYGVPSPRDAMVVIQALRSIEGGILVHCAQGHGRSAIFAAALLVEMGVAKDGLEAMAVVKRGRPNARMTRKQKDAIDRLVEEIATTRAAAKKAMPD